MRLYVARAEAPKPRLLNEQELAAILANHVFESACLEKLRLSEQVKLASRSQMSVGLHGAGLTHMLWARAGASNLEIRGSTEMRNNCYFSLASDIGHHYYYVPARQPSACRPSYFSDYVVEAEQLDAVLAQLVTDAA
jgi:capsular polysaccharide biosynthesis protein